MILHSSCLHSFLLLLFSLISKILWSISLSLPQILAMDLKVLPRVWSLLWTFFLLWGSFAIWRGWEWGTVLFWNPEVLAPLYVRVHALTRFSSLAFYHRQQEHLRWMFRYSAWPSLELYEEGSADWALGDGVYSCKYRFIVTQSRTFTCVLSMAVFTQQWHSSVVVTETM